MSDAAERAGTALVMCDGSESHREAAGCTGAGGPLRGRLSLTVLTSSLLDCCFQVSSRVCHIASCWPSCRVEHNSLILEGYCQTPTLCPLSVAVGHTFFSTALWLCGSPQQLLRPVKAPTGGGGQGLQKHQCPIQHQLDGPVSSWVRLRKPLLHTFLLAQMQSRMILTSSSGDQGMLSKTINNPETISISWQASW